MSKVKDILSGKYSLREILNYTLERIEGVFSLPRFRIFKTLYVNFRSLPFRQAVKLPIYVYGRVRIYSLRGSVKIDAPVKRGMIKIGLPRFGAACDYAGTYIRTNGVMEFKGSACFCNGASVSVLGGRLVLGDKVYFGEKVRIVCVNYITIGEGTRIAHESQLMDTNFHYMLDISKKQISYPKGEIKIGKWCWVGNRTTIQKGTVLPDNTIVASNSLLNKDYSDIPECSVIGGMPAKLIKQGMRRIFNVRTEHMLNVFFKENGYDAKYFYDGLDQDAFCQ